ncbi:MAG TPA: ATP-dependent DNA helicase RecQ [Candidatus Eisenbacteria bacterium]|nr:ATP-dependent DNA helicase RecQ [Candidatus Eisenbacteria bacterium]
MLESSAPLFHSARFTDPQQVLETVFGYREFRPGQRRIVDAVLAGRDCIGVMPTGAGKSLTFQIPAKLLPGAVLVLSPLISLMKDQVDALVRLGFKATLLNSTVEFEERRRRLAALRRGEIELLYLAPEALEGSLRTLLADCRVSLVVVDEAHCISHWGHDFRPAYRRLAGLKQELGDVPVLALTATATRRVAGDIIRQLGMRKPDGFKGSFFRPNLQVIAQKKGAPRDGAGRGRNVRRDLVALLRRHRDESAIVYCMSRRGVESTAAYLAGEGLQVAPYHAGLPDDVRARHQDAFARDQVQAVVATVAFGMGIDKSNVRLIVHRDMPKSVEAWMQEIGRAGRDGLPSECVVYYSWADVIGYDALLDGFDDPAQRAEARRRTVELYRLLDGGTCRHQAVCAWFDERIEPCGGSCDVCTGRGLEALIAPGAGAARGGGRAWAGVAADEPTEAGRERFERLRAVRRRLADAEGVPAYIVFSDAALRAMAERTPRTEAELLAVPGVGPVKLARYGAEFLAELRRD